jgi:diguanylate cyclase (GGDEF)-like protein
MDEFEALSASMLALNEDLNRAYRELARSKQAVEAREAEILRLSLTDALTGVGNRRMLDEVLAREVQRSRRHGEPLSLTVLDIDHFKRVNDTWGHDIGDHVLRQTGAVLQQAMRLSDIATRMGGEEFVLLLPATDIDEALICTERLRCAMASHDFGLSAAVTASFGVATLAAEEDGAALLARADSGLYQAKRQGRNCVMTASGARS